MKMLLLIVVFSLGTSITTTAQQTAKKEVYPVQVSIEHNEAVKNFSSDFVSSFTSSSLFDRPSFSLFGINNLASTNIRGSENLTVLSQQGYDIIGGINILGNQNTATLNQSGSDLLSILNIKGNYNEFNMTQQGIGLQNLVFILGSDLHFDALHTNNGFELNQHGVGGIPMSLEQTGGTLPIIIENN